MSRGAVPSTIVPAGGGGGGSIRDQILASKDSAAAAATVPPPATEPEPATEAQPAAVVVAESQPAAPATPVAAQPDGGVVVLGNMEDLAYFEALPPEDASVAEQLAWFEGRLYDAKGRMTSGLKAITEAYARQARVSLWEIKERELWRHQIDPSSGGPYASFTAYTKAVHDLPTTSLYRIINQQTVLLTLGPGVGDPANKDTPAAAYGVWKTAYRPERDGDKAAKACSRAGRWRWTSAR
jgi:hypothetical protein